MKRRFFGPVSVVAPVGVVGPAGVALFAVMGVASVCRAQTIDTIHVLLSDGGAEVRQRLVPEFESIGAFAFAAEEQDLRILEVVREGEDLLDATLTRTSGVYKLDVASGAPIRIRYTVSGASERIPLFVSGGRAELTVARGVEVPYLLRLEGSPQRLAAIDLDTSLPRFESNQPGILEAHLSSLPSFVRLSSRGAFTFARVADLVALALILSGVVWALLKLRAVSRAGAAAEDDRSRAASAEEP